MPKACDLFMKRQLNILERIAEIYTAKKIPRASAALSYYLTMTFFPLLICLYTMLGSSYDRVMLMLDFVRGFISAETAGYLEEFLRYVAENNNKAMMFGSLAILVTSSSAAMRTFQATIGEIQGRQRFQGLLGFAFSIVFSLVFLAAIYFSVLVMLTGGELIDLLNSYLPLIDISDSWNYLRFLLLGGIGFVTVWGVYGVSVSRDDVYPTWPGALAATVMLVAVSMAFSQFIGASTKYPLVYGSLAAVILLMLWLYTCCMVILCGAAFNVARRDSERNCLRPAEEKQREF